MDRQVTDICKMIAIKVLVQGIIISRISVYVLQCGPDDSERDDSYDTPIRNVRKLGKTEIVVIARDFNGIIKSNSEDYENQHGGYGYGYIIYYIAKI